MSMKTFVFYHSLDTITEKSLTLRHTLDRF